MANRHEMHVLALGLHFHWYSKFSEINTFLLSYHLLISLALFLNP